MAKILEKADFAFSTLTKFNKISKKLKIKDWALCQSFCECKNGLLYTSQFILII